MESQFSMKDDAMQWAKPKQDPSFQPQITSSALWHFN